MRKQKHKIKGRTNCFLDATICLIFALLGVNRLQAQQQDTIVTGNPVIKHKFTADPAALVVGDSVYLYTGHDQAPAGKEGYEMHEWLCFSSADMRNWTEHPVPLTVKDFAWAKADAWASQVIERNGKYYWY